MKLVKNQIRNQYYAMKCISRKQDAVLDRNLKQYQAEVSILRNLQHPNLIKMVECFENCEKLKKNGEMKYFNTIVFELAANGNLFDFINSQKLSEELARTYFHQIIEGNDFFIIAYNNFKNFVKK